MKKYWFLSLLTLIFLVSGCSLLGGEKIKPDVTPPLSLNNTTCSVPIDASAVTGATSTATGTISANKNNLPPVSQEEKRKTFTYEDEEMGVKLKYPGSCFFNKGIFQCSDFTLSIWVLDGAVIANPNPEKTFKDGQTEIRYTYINNNKVYAFMAWYDGEKRADLELVIDNIAKSLTFIK